MPFEWVNKHTGRFVLRYNEAWYLVRWLQDRRGRPKLSFWNTKFLGKYSVNLNLSNNYSPLSRSHLGMHQASLYLKTNLRVCLFTTSKGIKIGPPCQELRGVSKLYRTLKHPVGCVNSPPAARGSQEAVFTQPTGNQIYTVILQKFGVSETKFCPFPSCPAVIWPCTKHCYTLK